MDKIYLRQFKKEDKEAVYDLHIKALKQAGTFIETPNLRNEWDKDLEDIEGVYIKNNGEFFVVVSSDVVVGMGALRKINDITAEIKRMRVEPKLQGQGIGKMILDRLIEKAKELGYQKLILDVAESQQSARHLYETRDFVEYKRGELGGQATVFYERLI